MSPFSLPLIAATVSVVGAALAALAVLLGGTSVEASPPPVPSPAPGPAVPPGGAR